MNSKVSPNLAVCNESAFGQVVACSLVNRSFMHWNYDSSTKTVSNQNYVHLSVRGARFSSKLGQNYSTNVELVKISFSIVWLA